MDGPMQNAKQKENYQSPGGERPSQTRKQYSNGRHPAAFSSFSFFFLCSLFFFSSAVGGSGGHIIIIYIHGLGFNFYATRAKVERKDLRERGKATMRVKLKIKRYPKKTQTPRASRERGN